MHTNAPAMIQTSRLSPGTHRPPTSYKAAVSSCIRWLSCSRSTHRMGMAGQDRCEDCPAQAIDHVADSWCHGLARAIPADTRRHHGIASVAGGMMLKGDILTGQAYHRQERCVLLSAENAGLASKRRTHRGHVANSVITGPRCCPPPGAGLSIML